MLLAIDIGNTNIVVGFVKDRTILRKARMATDPIKTSDQYWIELKNIFGLFEFSPDDIEGIIISSVVPPVMNSCRTAVKKMTGLDPIIVGPGMKTGVNILLDNPLCCKCGGNGSDHHPADCFRLELLQAALGNC